MRTKVTLVLIFLNFALFYYIFWLRGGIDDPVDTSRLLGPETTNIQSLVIKTPNATTRLDLHADAWYLTSPVTWPASPYAVRGILTELQNLNTEATFTVQELAKSGQTIADFGLETPALVIEFTPGPASGTTVAPIQLRIGKPTPVANRLYILSPDGQRVHVVNHRLAEMLSLPLNELRSADLFNIAVFEALALTLEPPVGERVRFRRVNDRWNLESPITTRANKTAADIVIGELRALQVKTFVAAAEADTARTLLANPILRITLEGNKRSETLLLGPPAPTATPSAAPATPASAANPAESTTTPAGPSQIYYALMQADASTSAPTEKPTVFTVAVPDDLLAKLRNAQSSLREKRILDFDPATLTTITLSPEFVLQRLETPAAATSAWQIVGRAADQSLQPAPADAQIMERLIGDLSRLEAEEFIDVPSEADKENFGFTRPVRTITLTTRAQNSDAPVSTELQIGSGANRNTYAKLTTQSYIYRVSSEIVRNTPLSALYYRERLLRDLPASTPITAIKIIDQTTDPVTVLFETSLPIATTSPLAPKDRKATETLVAQLRTLRAKNFVANEFPKTVFTAGEERPWKYRLEATIAPPSGQDTRAAVSTLLFTERSGGTTQLAGSPDFNVVFEVEQPLLDSLFTLLYGPRDPGPSTPPPAAPVTPAAPADAPAVETTPSAAPATVK